MIISNRGCALEQKSRLAGIYYESVDFIIALQLKQRSQQCRNQSSMCTNITFRQQTTNGYYRYSMCRYRIQTMQLLVWSNVLCWCECALRSMAILQPLRPSVVQEIIAPFTFFFFHFLAFIVLDVYWYSNLEKLQNFFLSQICRAYNPCANYSHSIIFGCCYL